ncbi:MAG: hypothetical protein SFT90_08555 [Rickettsiales bacterium]|nr:hypothetical protein [Rickettsiales bacterium]
MYTKGLFEKKTLLKTFLPEIEKINFLDKNPDVILGWGKKNSSIPARVISKYAQKPYIALEDGFVRSVGLGSKNWQPLSIIVDKKSIYYDCYNRSDLDSIIEKTEFTPELIKRAKSNIEYIKQHRITKYNTGVDYEKSDFRFKGNKNILLIDQTFNDASIKFSGATAEDFEKMVNFAKKIYPSHNLVIKSHPEIIAGKKKGYLTKYYRDKNFQVIEEDINIYSLTEHIEALFSVCSTTGFEGLIAGANVYSIGRSFYSGWGLTKDNRKPLKERKTLSIEELFAASYLLYPRYINPYEKKLTTPEYVFELINYLKEKYNSHAKSYHCYGFTYWKQKSVSDFLKTPFNEVHFYENENKCVNNAQKNNGEIVVWSSKNIENISLKALQKNLPMKRMEDGFIRSVGLGSNLIPASSLVLDSKGIYYNSENPSDLENIINNLRLTREKKNRARDLINLITENNITKYNFRANELKYYLPKNKKIILVIGQVEDDASVKSSKGQVKTNLKLLEEARKQEPNSYIIYKPHPDVVAGNRVGHIPKVNVQQYADLLVENANISNLINRCDVIYTISSLVGFEGLLRRKIVRTFGSPFYAGWGLTEDILFFLNRTRKISIEHLVYASLIEYPIYFDIEARLPCEVENLVKKFINQPEEISKAELKSKKLGLFRFIKKHFFNER